MWMRCSKWILSSSKSPSSTYFQFIQQFRTQISRNPLKERPHRSIKNFDESKVLRVEPRTEPHPIRLLIRPTIFTIGVCKSKLNFIPNFFLFFFSKFVSCSFVSCAIWQYESQRNKLRKVKERWQSKEKPKQISSQVFSEKYLFR